MPKKKTSAKTPSPEAENKKKPSHSPSFEPLKN